LETKEIELLYSILSKEDFKELVLRPIVEGLNLFGDNSNE